jgi:phosphoglycolate phosphatase
VYQSGGGDRGSTTRVLRRLSAMGISSSGSSSSSSAATESMKVAAIVEVNQLHQFYYSSSQMAGYRSSSFTTTTATSSSMLRSSPPTIWQNREDASQFIRDEIDTVLFDCDGVLYRTLDACPGAKECIEGLLRMGKSVLFVTNNAGVNRRELRDKLVTVLGIESLTSEQMVSSSYSAARYLQQQFLRNDKDDDSATSRRPIQQQQLQDPPRVHVIGSSGLCEELTTTGGFHVSGGPSGVGVPTSMTRQELADYPFDEHPIDALVVGHDVEMNFRKLSIADNLLLRNPNALFIATNKDSFDLVGTDCRHIPGNGATVVALEYASRKKATNVGKPSRTLFNLIQQEHRITDPSRCLFVGDRLDTDIRFGKETGMKSLLVLTGVTTADMMEALADGTTEEPLPDFIAPYVGLLV